MVAFDTLAVAKELETAFTPQQAEALVKVFARALTEDLATKRDLADMETRLLSEISGVATRLGGEMSGLATRLGGEISGLATRLGGEISGLETRFGGEMSGLEARLRGEITNVETRLGGEIKDLKVDIVKWIVGALLVNFFSVAGLVITLIKSIAH